MGATNPSKDNMFENLWVDEQTQKERLDTCLNCERLIKLTTQCKECGCFMHIKTKLPQSTCPIGKW
jgi:hypothetical protein